MSCAAHRLATQSTCVLLWEKSLGNDDEEIDVQERRADGYPKDEPLVAQHPSKAGAVFVVKPLERTLHSPGKAVRICSRRAI